MAHKLVHENIDLGHYNEAPEGWQEVSEEYIITHTNFHRYTPTYMDYRQIIRLADGTKLDGPCRSVTLYFFHDDTGVGMEPIYWVGNPYSTNAEERNQKKHFRWYVFGCQHEYKDYQVPSGHRSGIHKAKCEKCGRLTEYDTSD